MDSHVGLFVILLDVSSPDQHQSTDLRCAADGVRLQYNSPLRHLENTLRNMCGPENINFVTKRELLIKMGLYIRFNYILVP